MGIMGEGQVKGGENREMG